jgi:hypothetical protein
MFRIHLHRVPGLACGGLLLLAIAPAQAQSPDDAGVVRITDSNPQLLPVPEGTPVASSPCPNCPGAVAGQGVCPNCPGGYPGAGCNQCCRCRCTRHVAQVLDWFNPCGMYTFSPDHGFAPPVKRPIYRAGVAYQKGFPDCWTGAPQTGIPGQRVPTVYMPTDTTQLGYYYQHVPYWQPEYNAIPPAPRPADWHVSMCQTQVVGHPAGVVLGTAPRVTIVPAMAAGPTPAAARSAEPLPIPAADGEGLPPAPALIDPAVMFAPGSGLTPASDLPQFLPAE